MSTTPKDEIKALTDSLLGWENRSGNAVLLDDPLLQKGGFNGPAACKLKGDEHAFKLLIASLEHEDATVRGVGARALGWVGDERAVTPLVEHQEREDDLWVRIECLRALGGLDNVVAMDALVAAAADTNRDIWHAAVDGLASIKSLEAMLVLQAVARKHRITDPLPPETIRAQAVSEYCDYRIQMWLEQLKEYAERGFPQPTAQLRLWRRLQAE